MIECDNEISLHGPFLGTNDYIPAMNGKVIPYVRIRDGAKILGDFASEPDPTAWEIVIDGRMSWIIPKLQIGNVLSMLATGISVGAGRACFGGPVMDPFNVTISGVKWDTKKIAAKSIVRPV